MRRALTFAMCLAGAPAMLSAQSSYEQLQAFSGVLSHLRANYVDSVETGQLVRAAINGMLHSLDPHSYYVSRADFEVRRAWIEGRLATPGLAIESADGVPTVVSVQRGSSAQKAGVLPGDRVLQVDSTSTAGLNVRDVETRLIGEKGSRVKVLVERGPRISPDTLRVNLKRDPGRERFVSGPQMVDAQTAYIRLDEFNMPAVKELKDAFKTGQRQKARQVILDLRGNPGGDVMALVEIASFFLPEAKLIFKTEGRKKTGVDETRVLKAGDFTTMPLILLIDESSASASEMLAGAMQDHDRALVVGRRSFGKALMQSALPLPNGDVIWLTTARIASPSGRVIQRRYAGVTAEAYYKGRGSAGAPQDSSATFRTDSGRTVRAGGGISPDVERSAASLPVWFSVAADTGLVYAVADGVAPTLPLGDVGRLAWQADSARWDMLLVTPFMARVNAEISPRAEADAALRSRLGRILAARAAEVRYGPEAAETFRAANDPDVRLALEQFSRLTQLLKSGAGR